MRLTFGVLILASNFLQTKSASLYQPTRLVQTQAAGIMGDLFKTPPPPPKGDPEHEIGGIDINLISANKHKSGHCGESKAKKESSSKWLAGLPGLGAFGAIFV